MGHAERAGMIMSFGRALHPGEIDAQRDASVYTELQIAAAVMQLTMFEPPTGMTARDVFIRDAGEIFDLVVHVASTTDIADAPR